MAIVEDAQGSAVINAEAGNNRSGYSSIYATMYVRGYDNFMYEYFGQNVFRVAKRVNEDISRQVLSVSYYPLSSEEADYNGMAKKYQAYLLQYHRPLLP